MQASGAAKLKTRELRRSIWVTLGGPGGLMSTPRMLHFPQPTRARRTVIRTATSKSCPGHDASSESAGSPSFRPTSDVDTDQIYPTCRVEAAILLFIFLFLCHGSSPPIEGSRRFCFFSLFFHGLVYRPSLPALGGVITTWKDYVLLDLRESFGLGWVDGNWAVMVPRSPEQGRGSHTVVDGGSMFLSEATALACVAAQE